MADDQGRELVSVVFTFRVGSISATGERSYSATGTVPRSERDPAAFVREQYQRYVARCLDAGATGFADLIATSTIRETRSMLEVDRG